MSFMSCLHDKGFFAVMCTASGNSSIIRVSIIDKFVQFRHMLQLPLMWYFTLKLTENKKP